jgi:hypothetical protein
MWQLPLEGLLGALDARHRLPAGNNVGWGHSERTVPNPVRSGRISAKSLDKSSSHDGAPTDEQA